MCRVRVMYVCECMWGAGGGGVHTIPLNRGVHTIPLNRGVHTIPLNLIQNIQNNCRSDSESQKKL
jgi:hypothetical protein